MIQDDGTGIYTSFCAVNQGTKRGEPRMGTHIMERSLLLGCLVALVIPANSLKCHSCVGNDNDCNPTEVTCPGENDKCSTTAMYIDSFPCKVRKIFKGCINSTATTRKLSLSPNEMTTISLQQEMCDSDFCNTQVVQDPAANANDLYCYSCISPGASCNSDSMNKLGCLGEQKICVDMKVMGSFGDIADVNIKGCGQIPSCKQNLVFASQTSSVTVQCCDGNFCNSGTDSVTEDKTPNEIQCYSCNTLDGASCSPEEVVKAQCYGDLTSCLEVAGTSMKDGRPVPSVIKGCATPSMCDSSVLPMLQKLGTATVKCCNGSLCNDQFSESSLKASGYLPTGNVSPETGIQNSPSSGQTSRPVKSRHPADTKYGNSIKLKPPSNYKNYNDQGIKGPPWNSNSNSGYPKPSLYAYNEFSNTGSIHNPNSVNDCNIFSRVDHTVGNNAIYANSESRTVPSPINYSSDNPGGSALGGEGISDTTTKSNQDVHVIPQTHTTLPDFTSYDDSNIVPNSNYDNSMDNPNNNDFNSSESVGFTEIVIDWNENQFNSPTETPDISTGYDTSGNSGGDNNTYNPDIISSANNNETSGYSMNIGGFANVPENNGTAQNYISTTTKTQSSSIEQNISGYGTNIYNTGVANNNGSGNYNTSTGDNTAGSGSNSSPSTAGIFTPSESHNVSHPTNYSLGQNNVTASPPRGSGYGGEYVSNSTNSNESTVLNAPTAVPDFTSYVDSNIVPNSNYDNSMDNPNNDDLNSYMSAGFTEIVIDWDDNQLNSPTEPSDLSTDHDAIGNYGGVDTAYNPDIILAANNNETSTNSMNIGSFENVSESNGKVQNLTSTTAKTHTSSIGHNISGYGTAPLPGGSGLSGEGVSNSTNYSNSNDTTVLNAPTAVPDFTSYVDSNIVPNSHYDNSMDNPNNDDFNNYMSAGFTEIVIDWEDNQLNSPTEASDLSTDQDTIGNFGGDDTAYNPDIILSANNNETSGYSMNIGGFANVPESNGKVQNFTSTTGKTHSSSIGHNISGYGIAPPPRGSGLSEEGVSDTTGNSHNNTIPNAPLPLPDFTSYVDSNVVPNSYYDNSMNNPNSNDFSSNGSASFTEIVDSVPNEQPPFQDVTSYVDSNIDPNSYYDNNMNNSNNNDASSYMSVGFAEVDIDWYDEQSGSPTVAPDISNGYDSDSNSGVDNTAYNSNIMLSATNNETDAHSVNIGSNIPENNGNIQNVTPTTKTRRSDIKHPSSGFATDIYSTSISNNNGSGNYISLSGNNTAGRENNSSAGTSESSSFGGYHNTPGSNESSTTYTSSGNGLEMTNEWNSNNNSSNHNMEMPIGYSNIPGANHSSPSYDSAGNITGISNQWISSNDSSQYMAIPGGYNNINGNNDSSMSDTTNGNGTPNQWISSNDSSQYMAIPGEYNNIHGNNDSSMSDTTNGNGTPNQWISSNDSSQYMAIPGGYNNIHGNNDSSMSYTDNETGISNNWSNSNSSNPNTAVLVGYGNIPENNASTTHYTSSSSENGMTNEGSNNSNPIMSVSGGYANMPENNASTTHYTSSSSENGMTNEGSNNSNPNMSVSGGYANMPENNASTTHYTSSSSENGMTNEGSNNSNPNMSVSGGYANMPENNASTTHYTSSSSENGMTNEGSNNSNPNMSVSGGYANMPGNNVSATNHTSSGSEMGMANEGNNSSNPNVSVPGEYANMPGNINHTSSYSSSDNGTGMTNEWINGNSSPPGGNYGSPNGNGSNYFSNNSTDSNSMLENNGSTYGNGSSLANSLGSMGSYLNNIFSEANDNGSNSHTSSWPNEFIPEGSSSSNETAWIYGSNNDPNMLHSNNNNGSFNIYNDMQSLFSKLNGSIHGNISKDINEWIQNNSFLSNLMHTGMNHNGSGPSGYNMNSLYNGSLINYFNSLSSFGKDNITSIFSGGNNESFNISKLFSGWSNTINNPNLMNPHGSSYSNIQNPNLLSLAFPNSNGSTNTNNYFGEAGFNGPPSNTYGVSSEGHNQLSPGENNNYGSNMGHESVNSSSYNSNMMIPGVGSGGPTYGGASADGNNNGHNTNMMGHDQNGPYNIWSNNNISLPDRSTNDSTSGGAGNGTGGANGTFSSASSLWTQSGSFVIFLAIALLVLN
ncbi:putative uncharacterized protein DDB_G0282133 [Eleutherodactylus coqui]|uniref:putative uncharacterized protein DDB_G0282133 n=1 Tax=Eleutherodactylus coqui TaxID=57060 RepID=UPI00346205ED